MNIHFATLGENTGHIYTAIKEFKVDHLVLISSEKFLDRAKVVKSYLGPFKTTSKIEVVDPFQSDSFSKIVDFIISEYMNHADDEIFVNITGGTNLMSSAGLTAALFIGATAYYVTIAEENPIIKVPIVKISFRDSLTAKQRIVFNAIKYRIKDDGEIKSIKDFAEKFGVSKQNVFHHLANLEEKNVIKIDRGNKEHSIRLTETGKLLSKIVEGRE